MKIIVCNILPFSWIISPRCGSKGVVSLRIFKNINRLAFKDSWCQLAETNCMLGMRCVAVIRKVAMWWPETSMKRSEKAWFSHEVWENGYKFSILTSLVHPTRPGSFEKHNNYSYYRSSVVVGKLVMQVTHTWSRVLHQSRTQLALSPCLSPIVSHLLPFAVRNLNDL